MVSRGIGLAVCAALCIGCGSTEDDGGDSAPTGASEPTSVGDTADSSDSAEDETGEASGDGETGEDETGEVETTDPGDTTGVSDSSDGGTTEAIPDDDPLFYTTLDDPASVAAPVFGNGAGAVIATNPANDFGPARVDGGLRADAVGERVLLPQIDGGVQNVENDEGTLEFWYQPGYDHDDSLKYTIAGTGTWKPMNATAGSIHFGKRNSSNQNMIFLILFDANGVRWEHNVDVNSYGWNAGDWLLIRITWDMNVGAGEQNMHLYIDDQELPLIGQVSTGPQPALAESPDEMIYIGCRDTTGNIPADGLYDEVRIWDTAIPPA